MWSTPIHRRSFADSRRRFAQPERRRPDRRSKCRFQKDWLLFRPALYYPTGIAVWNSTPANKLLPFPIRLRSANVCPPILHKLMLRENLRAKPVRLVSRERNTIRRSHESSIRHHAVPSKVGLANSPARLSPSRRNATNENPDNRRR